MFTFKRLRRQPRNFQRFTGLKVEQFEALATELRQVYGEVQQARLKRENRQREAGGGRSFALGLEERLLLTLMYLRLYVSQALLGYLFNLDESNVSREINERMLPSLKEVLPVPMQDELLTPALQKQAKRRIGTLDELLKAHPEFKDILADATEQEVPKPKEKLARKQRYSGKKKRHTLKSQVTVSNRLVLHLSKHVPGSVQDFNLLRATGIVYPIQRHNRKLRLDKDYEGVEAAYPNADISKPKRAQRNYQLNLLEKLLNQLLSSLRMPVEHVLAFLQKFNILAAIYRGPTHRYDDTFLVVAGLSNFRLLNKLAW
jgi:DDE superfamily endonuclease/Helix-turn-helix of DDE superfamily endonuclease